MSSDQFGELSESESPSANASGVSTSSYQNSGIYLSYIIGGQGDPSVAGEATMDPVENRFVLDETFAHPLFSDEVTISNSVIQSPPANSNSSQSGESSGNQNSVYSIKVASTPTMVGHVSDLTPTANSLYKDTKLANSNQETHTSINTASQTSSADLSDADVNLVLQHMSAFGTKELGTSLESFGHANSSTIATSLIASAGHH